MEFFDELGKKVTQMGQDAVAKAKNMTDQAKYHGQINEEERKVAESYRRIGELFYGVRGAQELPEYQTLMDEIDASKERIEELKYLLQAAKGMAVCPECGAEVSIDASFCPNCGTKMPKPEPEETPQEEAEEHTTEAETQEEPASEDAAGEQNEAAPEAEAEAVSESVCEESCETAEQ